MTSSSKLTNTAQTLPNLSNYTFLHHSSFFISTKGPNLL